MVKKEAKPPIAYSLEAQALQNIRNKLSGLLALLEVCEKDASAARRVWKAMKDDAEAVLVPMSQRQFLLWTDRTVLTAVGLESAPFYKVGNGTLNRYPELHEQVAIVTKDVRGLLQSANELAELSENQLARALRRERQRVKTLEEEVIRLRRKLRDSEDGVGALESEIRDLCRQHGLFRKPTLVKA
ncbi:hypothetical protein BJN34_01900 [Cupriavidus necator]|uniref:KfrA N-terminal DNA-binding domain-containing protein n=2 Tax=Cupriavidus necator TaxID=106590 RepID=A0A1U9UIZ8_CUPNE|nr:hypothetical protein BJN34_01900 [Cupriavidus necator]